MIAASAVDAARLSALAGFALVALWTPGPNNILLARSGAAFGFRRTIPHCVGVVLGYAAMMFILAYGLGEAFRAERTLREGVRLAGIAVLLYLAWRIAAAPWRESAAAAARPFGFWSAVAFQWVNPKGWVLAVSVSGAFVTGAAPLLESAICSAVFAVVGFTSSAGWTAFGVRIGRALNSKVRRRAFGVAMALLLVLCAGLLVFDDFEQVVR